MNYLMKKRDAMINSLQSGGGRLPIEYQEVEWIKNNSLGAYFDTQLSASNATKIQANAKFEWINIGNTSESCILGSRSTNDRCMLINMYPNYTWEIGYTNNYKSGSTFALNTIYEVNVDVQNGAQTVVANGDTVVSSNYILTISQTNPLYILSNNVNGVPTYPAEAKIYSLDIIINGVKERDLVPCYRKSDNEIGLYDLVHNQFYTNSGTGTFTKGADV